MENRQYEIKPMDILEKEYIIVKMYIIVQQKYLEITKYI